jgi:hypothetical protein
MLARLRAVRPGGRKQPGLAWPAVSWRAAMAGGIVLLAAGCAGSQPAGRPDAGPGSAAISVVARCGTTRTAANVPVNVEVARGQVPCSQAMTIERAYAKAIEQGKAPGNGGGGPVKVHGWTCQGFTTPEVLKTGNASKCVLGSTEILAVLPAPA